MSVSYLFPEFEVVRSETRCTACRICEKQCACGVHSFDEKTKHMRADESRCVDCQRCVSFCPTHALKIVKNDCTFRENANWQADTIREIYKQAASGGVLLSSMGTPKALPVYWDRILINASQVTNPPIDPLREPMETRVFLGKKPAQIARDENGRLKTDLPPQLELSMPVLFSAMSYGSISYNAQKSLALAAQRLGTCWNAGEGGLHEDFYDFGPQTVVQVASGRFGVYEGYLNAGAAIEIKMGQGAKPGIGGHLPGRKVGADVSRTRMIPQGSDAISPAPHHDIYSIEDLAELIFDLKNANPGARVSVKLVSEAGVGTIATGVAKGAADKILISGHNGGSGAAARDSIWHAGLPLELGLAEAQQTLLQNGLRSRVVLEADGKLMDGTDVAVACLLGAEEFGFATMPLISMGCLMQRDCQQDTCPAGIATQNCRLRRGFRGKPEHVEHFMLFVAEQLREVMASLGFRTVDEMVGHPECLRQIEVPGNRKANLLDLSPVLASATCEFGAHIPGADGRHFLPQMAADSELDKTLDSTLFVPYTADARAHLRPIRFRADIANVNRCVGTILGNAVTKAHPEGLPAGSITIDCDGSAGQSFGAFLPRGITLNVCGDANDYFGKGLSGGEVSVRPNPHATYKFDENIIVGNVAFFGATSGRGFINGLAGQRFGVRNSGATVVVEGCGNHGCEYMTGGLALILGEVGQNFAAGMTGGVAYVFDQYGTLDARVNHESVELKAPTADELAQIRALIQEHVDATQSPRGIKLLYSFETMSKHFVKVIPIEYERVLAIVAAAEAVGKTHAQAEELAFDIVTGRASAADVARFDVAGGAAGAGVTPVAATDSVASTKKEA